MTVQGIGDEGRDQRGPDRAFSGVVSGAHVAARIPDDQRVPRDLIEFRDGATAFFDEFFAQFGGITRRSLLPFRNKN